MDIMEQIRHEKLRCVRTGEPLRLNGNRLMNQTGDQWYTLVDGKMPVIIKDQAAVDAMLQDNPAMEKEYKSPGLYHRLRNHFYKDYSSHAFCRILWQHIQTRPENELIISIGGGPTRDGKYVTNLNIGPFPNVDIVGDAHDLPYCDGSVDAIYCSAVLEHVREPASAVREMQRVLKPGGKVLSVIPFLQAYHGYPDHYQNFTLHGHEYLYSNNGFRVLSSGSSLGPIVAMTTLNSRFFLEYLPKPFNLIIGRGLQLFGLLVRPLDRLLETRENTYILASATYVLAEKI